MLYTPQKWTQVRRQGKYAYIVFYGMVRAGTPFGLIIFFLAEFAPELHLTPFAGESFAASILFGMLYGTIFGLLVGHVAWRLNEREFRKWRPREDDDDDRHQPRTPSAKRTRYE